MAEVEYVVLERSTYRADGAGTADDHYTFVPDPEGTYEFWQEIARVTAPRKSVVLRDHTPESGTFNAIPSGDWDSAMTISTESVPKRTMTPVNSRPKRQRKKKDSDTVE
jgi:hypothetical protein